MKLLFVTLCLTVAVSEVYSYQCYNCAGQLGKGDECEKDVKKSPTNECYNGGVCSIVVTKKSDNVKVLTRACQAKDICNILKNRFDKNQDESLEKCETCESELCNKEASGAAVLPSFILTVCVLILVSLRSYH